MTGQIKYFLLVLSLFLCHLTSIGQQNKTDSLRWVGEAKRAKMFTVNEIGNKGYLKVNIFGLDKSLVNDKHHGIIQKDTVDIYWLPNNDKKINPITKQENPDFIPCYIKLGSVANNTTFYLSYNKSYRIVLKCPQYFSSQIILHTIVPPGRVLPPYWSINIPLIRFTGADVNYVLKKFERVAYYNTNIYNFSVFERQIITHRVDSLKKNTPIVPISTKRRTEQKENAIYDKHDPSHNLIRTPTGASAQLSNENDTINRIDIDDKKEGHWIHFGREAKDTMYQPHSKYFEGFYEKGERSGEWVKYFPSGDTSAVMDFDKNISLGNFRFFYANGKMHQEGLWNFRLNRLNGKYREYFDNNNLHKEFQHASDGTRNGLQFVYHTNGNLSAMATMKRDSLDGFVNYYSEGGEMYLQQEYKMGVLIGEKYCSDKRTFEAKFRQAFKELMLNNDSIIGQKLKKNLFELTQLDHDSDLLLKQREIDLKEMNLLLSAKDKEILRTRKKLSLSEIENENNSLKIARQKLILLGGSLILLMLLVLFFYVLRSNYLRKKANALLAQQKDIIETKNHEITDSINYAKRIQQAKLPSMEAIYSALPDCFVLFKPKDIVSGDFYFFHKDEKSIFIASADCTGHGVPGALMSMIGSEKLDDAMAHSADTSEILRHLNKGIKTSLRQSDSSESTRDGMDIALCRVDTDARVVKYAGANRPIWIIRNGLTTVEEIKATKKAIGGFTEDNQYFDSHEIKLQKGDTFYISTDGYADTFRKDGKKLMTKRFKELLLSIQDKSLKEQERHLDDFIEDWKGGAEQMDDILVIGVRL